MPHGISGTLVLYLLDRFRIKYLGSGRAALAILYGLNSSLPSVWDATLPSSDAIGSSRWVCCCRVPGKIHHIKTELSCMSSQKCCPIKFGTVVNDEGMVVELPCCGKDCAWFFDDNCSIRIIAQELSTSQSKKYHKRMSAE